MVAYFESGSNNLRPAEHFFKCDPPINLNLRPLIYGIFIWTLQTDSKDSLRIVILSTSALDKNPGSLFNSSRVVFKEIAACTFCEVFSWIFSMSAWLRKEAEFSSSVIFSWNLFAWDNFSSKGWTVCWTRLDNLSSVSVKSVGSRPESK